MKWEKLELNNNQSEFSPRKRWGHTCNSIFGGKYLYIFGGYGKDNFQTNDIHVFETTTKTWSRPVIKGVPPPPRDSHSCTTVRNSLFVFGGTDGNKPLQDLHIFDTGGEGPEAREGHGAALVGKRLFIFGGCGKSSDNSCDVYYDDLYILDTETLTWKRAVTSGSAPSARDSHTCSSWKGKIVVVAGEDSSDYYLSDVYILDTDTLVWKELNTTGQILPPRAGHSTVTIGKNLFVFGGFRDDKTLYDDLHMLDIDSGIWTKVMTVGQGPSARFSVAGDAVDYRSGVFAFIGGCNKDLEAMDDMFYLYTEMWTENGQEKISLRKELKRKCQEQSLSIIKDVPKHGNSHDLSQPLPLRCAGQENNQISSRCAFNPSLEKTFEAKVIESSDNGYFIETTINGKRLRGVVFSYKPGFSSSANAYISRPNGHSDSRRTDEVVGGSNPADGQTPKPVQPEVVDVQGKNSSPREPPKEINRAPSLGPSDFSQIPMITGDKTLPDLKHDGVQKSTNCGTDAPSENPSTTAEDMVTSLPSEVPEMASTGKKGIEEQNLG